MKESLEVEPCPHKDTSYVERIKIDGREYEYRVCANCGEYWSPPGTPTPMNPEPLEDAEL